MNLYGGILILGVAALLTAAMLWRLRRDPAPGGLGAMLARQGLDWGGLAAAGSIGEVSTALDRCAACHAKARCAQWIESGEREGHDAFCPNAAFFQRVTAAAKR